MTLEQYLTEIENKLKETDFYDNIIMFCGPLGSEHYNRVCLAAANAISIGFLNDQPADFMVAMLLESNHASVKLIMTLEFNDEKQIKH